MHVIQNFHVYTRETEQALELIKRAKTLQERETQNKPQLKLNVKNSTSFYDITIDDFEVVDYEPIKPQLTFDIAI